MHDPIQRLSIHTSLNVPRIVSWNSPKSFQILRLAVSTLIDLVHGNGAIVSANYLTRDHIEEPVTLKFMEKRQRYAQKANRIVQSRGNHSLPLVNVLIQHHKYIQV